MKINVNTGKRTPQMRILSAFMAVLIFSLTFVQVFEWTGGNIALAAGTTSDGIIRPIPDYSRYKGPDSGKDPNDGDYVYTGRIKPVAIDLYDYMTDKEINDNNWNYMNSLTDPKDSNNDYSVSGCYTYYNRYNPYDKFNKKISDMPISGGAVLSPHEQNVTIKFTSSTAITGDVYVYGRDNSDAGSFLAWPGEIMTANAGRTEFTYTFIRSRVTHLPKKFIFNGGNNRWQTGDYSLEDLLAGFTSLDDVQADTTYTFTSPTGNMTIKYTGTKSYTYAYIWNENNGIVTKPTGWPGISLGSDKSITIDLTDNTWPYSPTNVIFNSRLFSIYTTDFSPFMV